MMWIPEPMDLSDVDLGENSNELIEKIAENTHNVWGKGRYDAGWTYGPVRNDELKQTPCMVPYEDLPDFEKEYDRQTAINAIKVAIKLGFVKMNR